MDLEALGSPVAARAVLAGYRDAGGDPGDDALLAFFAVYRALVRAKVSLVRATQAADPPRPRSPL
jgi:aminoglycoside phosphotransferase family enzyme